MKKDSTKPKIIFILGIMPRSGTHFLANLLCQHSDCEKSIIPEDGLIASVDFLMKYAYQLNESWELNGKTAKFSGAEPKKLLLKNLGDGLVNFLISAKEIYLKPTGETQTKTPKRLVTKTPQVINIDKFFKLFPDQQLLIIVRDGRDVVESINKSFNYNYEETIKEWANAARKICKFEENEKKNKDRYLIVKYEELHTFTEREMRKILEFLELDVKIYEFQKALDLPVVGSSTFKRGEGDVHWIPVKKNADFDPLARTANWTRSQHERFNWLAKNELAKFGYKLKEFEGQKLFWKSWNQFHDLIWQTKIWWERVKRIPHFIKKRLDLYFG